ncbi:MAG: hypothetical protein ACD_52C00135G0005 [uncultured bacterium]|uniref:DUF458 domain-containing protein n=1 Tax=Candidatus Woesebacteria bacterium RIFCSPHIGHO2_12_FULL_41_24 TaxID=1802510 RepID=A0A1F8AUG7_9BACT|nr:MAG: hypothetical protein ACD_52C00135G0005 [uncultured bacterium]OGM14394.1 MAG: hypothetical protein A2W15_02485 [Candidatus Woesebacteria bacterium RBG_16_41_13]OGM28612.1 MAG: hypothetical protein A2873_05760 [Candidatus Woesebacteria bacterium RIFCSPHIGHO2_01_FULL_42_80]OGM34167.1 MAG: hypothetical protein A3D84_04115 [Candidatus Woesebacteria bacterium RIFCSPHIGHO2_02_FULL_42_20]OGM55376.1 MAG: hypothetical protein A3E44_03780 [Candidatus Woesebacteria bacterium RIFCSPHIGHO2_12_FULL_41
MQENNFFFNPSMGRLSSNRMIAEIKKFVQSEPGSFYRLVIGTDSQVKQLNGVAEIRFISAIVIHRTGRGGRYFWQKKIIYKKPVLRDKIYTETLLSLNIARELVPQLRRAITPAKYDLEIHVDVGPLGPTRDMIKEVVGMVNGNGFKAKTKPDSWGASSVADKHT